MPLIPHGRRFTGRHADASPPSHAYTRARSGYKSRRSLACAHTRLAPRRRPAPLSPSPSSSPERHRQPLSLPLYHRRARRHGRALPRRRGGGEQLRPAFAPRTGVLAPVPGEHPGAAGHARRADGVAALSAAWSVWSTTDFHRKSTVHGEADSWVHGSRNEVPHYYKPKKMVPPNGWTSGAHAMST